MRKLALATAALLIFGPNVWAGGDKVSETCVDITSINGGSEGFTNGTSRSKIKLGKCKIQIQLKSVSLNPGEEVICVAGADAKSVALPPNGAGNSIVLRAKEKNGSVKMKGDLSKIGCGAPGMKAISWNSGLACYREDLTYSADNSHADNWQAACLSLAPDMAPLPNADANCATNPKCDKENLLGLCQGFTAASLGMRIPPPSSNEICRQGLTSPEL